MDQRGWKALLMEYTSSSFSCQNQDETKEIIDSLDPFFELQPNDVKFLLESADQSPFGLIQWLAALKTVFEWLQNQKKRASFEDTMGYIHCCADIHPQMAGNLSEMVKDMLEQQGFEKAHPSN